MTTSPFEILETLYPCLSESACFARLLQNRIQVLEEKSEATNIFAAALSDADLSIQAHVEVSLLAHFPEIPFFGEEWKSSRNNKYLRGNWFVEGCPYLVTLDPIDGTRPYLDQNPHFQIILTVVSRSAFEAAIVLFPAFGEYVYAVRGRGAFRGALNAPFSEARTVRTENAPRAVYISQKFHGAKPKLLGAFPTIYCPAEYEKGRTEPYFSGILRNEICGAVLDDAQIIDGAALAFVAEEMGHTVRTLDGQPFPAPGDFPDLVLPGLVVGDSESTIEALRDGVKGEL